MLRPVLWVSLGGVVLIIRAKRHSKLDEGNLDDGHALERIHDPRHRRMLPIFDLDPVLRPSGLIWAIPSFRYQSLQAHLTGRKKQIGPDLSLFEVIPED